MPRANIPLTIEQRGTYNYLEENIDVIYADEIKQRVVEYDAANAEELANEENPTENDLEEGKSIKTLITENTLSYLSKYESGTVDKKLRIIIGDIIVGNIGKTILIGNLESIAGVVQVLEPDTDEVIGEYQIRYFENGGGGVTGLIVSAFSRRANVRLAEGLGQDIARVLKEDIE